ncbi:MAG: beta-galactosidase [Lachnospiraceae bacterium]|jgi:beta-galactosidase|nr:beta-galactosidase [Lachnospiraceae bacterium]
MHKSIEIGAVYYRRSNPPERDWERDYRTAAADGHTMFRHWFTWNCIHVAPGTFDWAPYDRQLDLAAEHGIKTVIAEHVFEAPDWLYRSCPEGRVETADGSTHSYSMGDSAATGITRMCLDHPTVNAQAREYLAALAARYRGHKGLYAYDIWNECSMYSTENLCYCPATQGAFREWLKARYGHDLDRLRTAWKRYSLASWEDIELPRRFQPYPDTMDMMRFRLDNALGHMKMRYDVIRANDPDVIIAAHGNAKTFCDLPVCGDDYRPAQYCDVYGYTYWYGNKCSPFLAGDMIRIAAGGKEYWRAEGIGNHDFQNRGSDTPMPEKEAMQYPDNIRLDALISLATGARGYLNPRWRPLQDGGLFDAYGWYNLDGSRSERSEEVKALAAWANDTPGIDSLWRSSPVKGQVGLLLSPQSQLFCQAMYGSTDYYSWAYQGAYEAFLDSAIQADPILMEHIDGYALVYLPFGVAMSDGDIKALSGWVERGGTLVAEGPVGFFDENIHAYEHQPSRGLDILIGARSQKASFAPDMWGALTLDSVNGRLRGGVYRQSFLPGAPDSAGAPDGGGEPVRRQGAPPGADGGAVATAPCEPQVYGQSSLPGAPGNTCAAMPIAWYENGEVAGVEHRFGKGTVRIYGTMLGYGYKKHRNAGQLGAFRSFLALSGQRPMVRTDCNTGIVVRVCASKDDDSVYLWCINTEAFPQAVTLELGFGQGKPIKPWRCPGEVTRDGDVITLPVPAKDAAVIQIM